MKMVDFLVLLAVVAVVSFAVGILLRNRKKGKSSCGGNCSRCSHNCK